MNEQRNYSDITTPHSGAAEIAARNVKVLQQTYLLLAANVLFSAFCAFIGMRMGIKIPGWLAMAAVFGGGFAVSRFRNSGAGIAILFAFTGFLGLYVSFALSALMNADMGGVVVKALVGTAIIFASLSAYVLYTRTNFNFLGGFLFVGILVAFLAGIGATLFNMTGLSVVVSGAFLLISSGYILYDTSNIIHGEETNYIVATMSLFMNIFNIFVSLLNLLSVFGGGRD